MAGTPGLLSGTFASRYTIERELGRGASATVYLARDTQRGKTVAIKVLRPELAQSVGAERFLREIKFNDKLQHPHIVPVIDSGEHESRLFFVLPWMEEGSLRELLSIEKQLPIERAVEITRTICGALDHAHKQGLIHRDVKPENILFTSAEACLADFGIARAIERAIDDSTTETGLVRGTPAYMSPEQASGSRNYDGRSDIYSLALVLYEMLAGVAAFIGATPENVIAQRFQHAPRPVRVYRSTVTPALEQAIHKALAVSPADRYATAGEFSAALEAALRAPSVEARPSGALGRIERTPALAGIVALTLVVFAGGGYYVAQNGWPSDVPPDTTTYVLLPLEVEGSAPTSEIYDRLHGALGTWKGITAVNRFEMRGAVGSEEPVRDDRQLRRAVKDLGAGRYVRARVSRAGTHLQVHAALFNAEPRLRLYETSIAWPVTTAAADSVSRVLVDRLLLRRADPAPVGSRVLPAVQLFLNGMEAQEEFRLARADSLLGEAVELDRDFARAALWLAQVRAWQTRASERWLPWARRAASAEGLSARERSLAGALVALGDDDYAAACRTYRGLTRADTNDFVAWYGLGQCQGWDRVVVRDARSPSGWRYRSSYHQAIRAYVQAFELAPALHRNFEPAAFTQLRTLLVAGRDIARMGVAFSPDTGQFRAQPVWSGDSLLFVPYPMSVLRAGAARYDPLARARAISEQKSLFGRIARVWATAFPRNASTKEAVAIALEMVGNPAALDTLRQAREFVQDKGHGLRLAAEEVFFLLSFGRNDPRHLQDAVRLRDSLLTANPNPTPAEAKLLAPLAVLQGRCWLASSLAATANQTFDAAADAVTVLAAMGCRNATEPRRLDAILNAAAAADPSAGGSRAMLEYSLFGRAYYLADSVDPARITRTAAISGDYHLRAYDDLAKGDLAAVRGILMESQRQRGPTGMADGTPDAVYPEAKLWLALHDSVAAREWLDPMLNRPAWLEVLLDDPIATGSLMRSTVLRARLARSEGDDNAATRWGAFATQLWARGDAELTAVAGRLVP